MQFNYAYRFARLIKEKKRKKVEDSLVDQRWSN